MSLIKPKAVILDVDGTLCDVEDIRHYVMGESKDFDSFHKASLFCPPVVWVQSLAANITGVTKIVVTGRSERYRKTTTDWLHKHEIRASHLWMRKDHDQRKDFEVKKEILDNHIAPYYDVIFAVDDNPNVIQLWQSHGIPVIVVPGWPEGEPAS
jgi:uncharacterized HAD superfamily protein